jgi:hypothetical protein
LRVVSTPDPGPTTFSAKSSVEWPKGAAEGEENMFQRLGLFLGFARSLHVIACSVDGPHLAAIDLGTDKGAP